MKTACRWVILAPLLLLTLASCATLDQEDAIKDRIDLDAPLVEPPKYIFHRVKPGETMATISKWYSGKEGNWKEIAEENPNLKPFALKKNEIVKVPSSLATVHLDPPPGSTVPPKRSKKPTSSSSPRETGGPDDDWVPAIEEGAVFGPK